MKISVMITTRNRCADLERTLRVLRGMNPLPDEMLITLDGCTDNSVVVVRHAYPDAQITENVSSLGSVASRDTMLRLAAGDVVVSLDDDSYPVDADFFGRLPALFAEHPEAAVITFPELRDKYIFASETKTANSPGHYVSAYPNCAAAMNRNFYLSQPGFPRFFGHMYEEPDFALQCYGGRSAVWFEPSLVIQHHLSNLQRQPICRHHQNARNELWSVWMRCPWPWLPAVSLFRIWRQLHYAWSEGLSWVMCEPGWWTKALMGVLICYKLRQPLRWNCYLEWMKLAKRPLRSKAEFRRAFHF